MRNWVDPLATYDVEIRATGTNVSIFTSTHRDRADLLLCEKAYAVIVMDRCGSGDDIENEILPDLVENEETEEEYFETLTEIAQRGYATIDALIDPHFTAFRSFCSVDSHADDAIASLSLPRQQTEKRALQGFLARSTSRELEPTTFNSRYFIDRGISAVAVISDRFRGSVGVRIPGRSLRPVVDEIETRKVSIRLGRSVVHHDVIESIRLGADSFRMDDSSWDNVKPAISTWFWMPPKRGKA